MIRFSVMYPGGNGARFDMQYYCNTPIPLVRQTLGATLKGVTVDEGISQPGLPAPFLAIGHLLFDSVPDLLAALDAHGPKLMADIPNYTNVQPTIQISDIKI